MGYIGIMEKKMETTIIQGLGFAEIRGTVLRVPIRRIIVSWGLYAGPSI